MPKFETLDIAIGEIIMSSTRPRSRALQPAKVAEIAESFEKRGQLQPIIVTHSRELAAGEHRLEAAKLLKWDTIRCTVVPEGTSDAEVELIELDENLVRAELGESERTKIMLRRKELYDAANPDAPKRGGNRKSKDREKPLKKTFAGDAADKTGESKSAIKARIARGRKLVAAFGEQVLDDIKGTSLEGVGEMDALIELPKDEGEKLIADAKAGKEVSAKKRVEELKDIKDKADAAQRKADEAALKGKGGTKSTMQAAPEKSEEDARQEALDGWWHSLHRFNGATVRMFPEPEKGEREGDIILPIWWDVDAGNIPVIEFLHEVLGKLLLKATTAATETAH
jgi:ParB-like chromosome segregation protein Spo0J